MNKKRFDFNKHILSEFSDSDVRNMEICLENAIDLLYTLSDVALEVGDNYSSNTFERLAFELRYIIPTT